MSRRSEPSWQPCTAVNWRRLQVKRAFAITLGKMLQSSPAHACDEEVTYLKAQHVQWDGITLADLPTMWASKAEVNALMVKQGDLLVCEGGEVGRSAIVGDSPKECTIIQNALHLVRGRNGANPRFLNYLLRHAFDQGWFDVICNKSTIAHFTVEKFEHMWTWLPDNSKQHAIADYLDRETPRLDALITEKERVLELLAEKRRALITRAVTRGIDLNVPLRNSGISWLGEIPAHWETQKFTRIVKIIEGQVDPESTPFVHWPLIAPNHVESETGRLLYRETAADQGAMSGKYKCRTYDVIYSKIRPALRKATLAAQDSLCSADMYPLRAGQSLQPEYLLYLVLSEPFSVWATLESTRVAMPKINREALGNIKIPVPPYHEQEAIVRFIKSKVSRIDELRNVTTSIIGLLRERRSAIIEEAVSGQVDAEQLRC